MYLSSNLMELILVWGSVCVVGVWSLTGPNNVSIQSGQELTVQCAYNTAYKSYIKYWCKGDSWRHCDIVVSTTEKNNEVTNGRFFINDTFSIPSFSVTMADVKPADSDTYYCGVEKSAHDMMHKIIVHVLPGICNKTAEWTDVVEFPSNVTEIQENRVIEVSCQKQYEKKTFGLQCRKESREFLLFPEDERSSCVERCGKLNVSSWNITLCPDQEYYDPDTMTVPSKWTTRCHKGNKYKWTMRSRTPELVSEV
ncbi:CMRF35-like molecule 5 isoform X6 [Mixophyes fleayi]|uniref:CMRF35-like molecule 5 isoform X6 n=1 Tax=Mixophyes fleayi TaxID=3061075 RepID=UPI003F4DDBEE